MVNKLDQTDGIRDQIKEALTCKARDIGLDSYLVCLEKSSVALRCGHRFAFGFDHLCASQERIKLARGRESR